MKYPQQRIAYRFYGKNIENMIHKVTELPEGTFRTSYINAIGSFMKTNCRNWNDEVITDEQIMAHLVQLSDGKIVIDSTAEIDFKAQQQMRRSNNNNNQPSNRNGNNRNHRNNNNSNNRNNNNNNNNNRKFGNNQNNKNSSLGTNSDNGYRKFNTKER
jgi:hypothetical protein